MNNKFGLSDELYKRFKSVHDEHLSCWGAEERKEQHSLFNIEKVDYKANEDLFYVYYKETENFPAGWYHYDSKTNDWW